MKNSFTHYWRGDTCDLQVDLGMSGEPLRHVAGGVFLQRGVAVGDRIYAITARKGELFLIARMEVGKIVLSDAEARKLLDYEPWSAHEHLIAAKGSGTPIIFDRAVPRPIVQQLRFKTTEGPQPAKFVAPGQLDRQTMRGVRQLTTSSALSLDELL